MHNNNFKLIIMKIFRFIPVLMIFFFWSCLNEGYEKLSEQLSIQQIEQISINLSIDGEINPELLIGEWECNKFAYTAEGINISRETDISDCVVNIRDTYLVTDEKFIEYDIAVYFKNYLLPYSIIDNRIKYILEKSACYPILEPYTNDELEVENALQNTYSFIIKGNELMIYFTGVKNKNLLILKKR